MQANVLASIFMLVPLLQPVTHVLRGGADLQMKYSWFINGLVQENIHLNRKMLSELATYEPHSFKALVEQVQFMRGMGKQGNPATTSIADRTSVGSFEQQPVQVQQLQQQL